MHTWPSQTICTTLAMSRKACDYQHLLCHLFFVNHLNANPKPCFWRAVLLQQHFVEDLADLFFRLIAAIFDLFSSDPTAVSRFPSFEAVNRILDFTCCELRSWLEVPRHFSLLSMHVSASFLLVFSSPSSFSYNLQRILRTRLHCLFVVVMASPFMFL